GHGGEGDGGCDRRELPGGDDLRRSRRRVAAKLRALLLLPPRRGGAALAMSVLVAGVGNVFRGDDGFGPEVVRKLSGRVLPAGTRVEDFGIRGIHLVFELLEPIDLLIVVDAVSDRKSVV